MRFEEKDTCAECRECDGSTCEPVRQKLRDYNGIRFTSDGFDCALPVSIDSFSHCSYACLYCFSDNLVQHRAQTGRGIGAMSLAKLEGVFSGEGEGKDAIMYREALKYHERNAAGYPCPVQLGAICDPMDNIERNQGWLLRFIKLAIKYRQPVRMSTKGALFLLKEYREAIAEAPELFWVAFSIISPDDDLMAKVDVRAPVPSRRIKAMKALGKLGVRTSLRFRPIMPGISDATAKYPHAYRTLIDMAADAGARAVSYEVAFTPGAATQDLKNRWHKLETYARVPFIQLYKTFGPNQACNRPAYGWTENIMHAIAEETHKRGMVIGVSDPVWKQLGDVGCCCGIDPDDEVFGNWQRQNMTNALLTAKRTGKKLYMKDWVPAWARKVSAGDIINPGAGPLAAHIHHSVSWASHCYEKNWNTLRAQRSVLNYFQGALMPCGWDKQGNYIYEYKGLKRKHEAGDYWNV